jgi:choline-glycine betaine transporter
LPCRISSILFPLLGNAVHGWTGKIVDSLCALVSVGGIAASLGYVGLQLTGGIHYAYGTRLGLTGTLLLILLLTVCITASAVSGLDRGMRVLSNFNIWLALGLLVFVCAVGPAFPALRMSARALLTYLTTLPSLTVRVGEGDGITWMSQWTVMYYAWWFSWAPMVGVFYARVSRGRTVRQLIAASLMAPVAADILWFSVFGGSSLVLDLQKQAGIADVMLKQGMEYPIFALLYQLPLSAITVPLLLLLITIFFVTSGDSSSMSISILSSGGNQNPPIFMRVTWGTLQGVTAAVLISIGGIEAIQAASIVAGFAIVVLFRRKEKSGEAV